MIGKILSTIWDILFPSSCLGCGREGAFLCGKCLRTIRTNQDQACPICKRSSLRGRTHDGKCAEKTFLGGLIVAARYKGNSLLDRTITRFKYRYSKELEEQLGVLLTEAVEKNFTADGRTFIVPIPLHSSRRRWRGFNQAEALAEQVGKALGIPVVHLLNRRKKTRQQARLGREERLENLRGAFGPTESPLEKAPRTRILLIDDVASTLATLEEAAKVLRKAGHEDVTGAVLARG